MTRVLFAAKHNWTTLRISRPLFVDSYLQVTWWTFGQWKEGKICIEWLQSLFFLNSSVGRGTPGMRLYTTVILEALFMIYLLRNYLCFSFFFHSRSSLLVRWSFHMLQPSLYQCVSSFPWCNWRNWFLKPNAELWCLLGLFFASGPGCLAIENFKLNLVLELLLVLRSEALSVESHFWLIPWNNMKSRLYN